MKIFRTMKDIATTEWFKRIYSQSNWLIEGTKDDERFRGKLKKLWMFNIFFSSLFDFLLLRSCLSFFYYIYIYTLKIRPSCTQLNLRIWFSLLVDKNWSKLKVSYSLIFIYIMNIKKFHHLATCYTLLCLQFVACNLAQFSSTWIL